MSTCKACQKPIELGTYITTDKGHTYHEACYNYPLCSRCNGRIESTTTKALGKDWHPNCFGCFKCGAPLSNTFHVEDGQPLCKGCGTATKTPQRASAVPESVVRNATGTFEAENCSVCFSALGEKKLVALNRNYHPACFKCQECSKELTVQDKREFNVNDGLPYCEPCYFRKFHDKCAKCNQFLSGTYVSAMGKHWHSDCFECSKCNKALPDGKFIEKDGAAHCSDCGQ